MENIDRIPRNNSLKPTDSVNKLGKKRFMWVLLMRFDYVTLQKKISINRALPLPYLAHQNGKHSLYIQTHRIIMCIFSILFFINLVRSTNHCNFTSNFSTSNHFSGRSMLAEREQNKTKPKNCVNISDYIVRLQYKSATQCNQIAFCCHWKPNAICLIIAFCFIESVTWHFHFIAWVAEIRLNCCFVCCRHSVTIDSNAKRDEPTKETKNGRKEKSHRAKIRRIFHILLFVMFSIFPFQWSPKDQLLQIDSAICHWMEFSFFFLWHYYTATTLLNSGVAITNKKI